MSARLQEKYRSDVVAALQEEFKAEMDRQVASFEARKDFKLDAPFDHVYGTTHAVIEEQRAEYLDSLAKEGGDA